MSDGIAGARLSAEDLERELTHLHEKRHAIFVNGTADQWTNHVVRTRELEQAYLERFADRITDADRKAAQ